MADDRRQQVAEALMGRGYGLAERLHLADDLLPLIDRVAAEAAAEALEAAEQWQQKRLLFWSPLSTEYAEGRFDGHDVTANDLRARAAQLRASPTVTETQETPDAR